MKRFLILMFFCLFFSIGYAQTKYVYVVAKYDSKLTLDKGEQYNEAISDVFAVRLNDANAWLTIPEHLQDAFKGYMYREYPVSINKGEFTAYIFSTFKKAKASFKEYIETSEAEPERSVLKTRFDPSSPSK